MSGLLKFITCGSVDDGKSTLIGHILYDSKLLYADQEEALLLDSKVGSRGGDIDYSLLLDGLMAEREQGITIDVAYRYFSTDKRSFIVADTPGHEEYTRNMAVGASFAQLAIVMVDATQGVLVQTRRHARICALMGIKYFVFAINKMDLAGYSEKTYKKIQKDIKELAESLGLYSVKIIPVSATAGDNVTVKSENMPWYEGESLTAYLENVEIEETDGISNEEESAGNNDDSTENVGDVPKKNNTHQIFYMPVQRVCRPTHEFRGFQGQIESGKIKVGDKLITLPSNEEATIKSILVGDKEQEEAFTGQPVTISLDREVDVSRGCVLTDSKELGTYNKVETTILWMDDDQLVIGKEYLAKLGAKKIPATVKSISYKTDVNSGEHLQAEEISKNEIATCVLEFNEKIVVDEFKSNKTLGELILIDRVSHATSACGVVDSIIDEDSHYFKKGKLYGEGYIFEELYVDSKNAKLIKEVNGLQENVKEAFTYEEGDNVLTEGVTFSYPDSFDIISSQKEVAVLIRDKKIIKILPVSEYKLEEDIQVLDEHGFGLAITTQQEVEEYIAEKPGAAKDNKWAELWKYRKVVFK